MTPTGPPARLYEAATHHRHTNDTTTGDTP